MKAGDVELLSKLQKKQRTFFFQHAQTSDSMVDLNIDGMLYKKAASVVSYCSYYKVVGEGNIGKVWREDMEG